ACPLVSRQGSPDAILPGNPCAAVLRTTAGTAAARTLAERRYICALLAAVLTEPFSRRDIVGAEIDGSTARGLAAAADAVIGVVVPPIPSDPLRRVARVVSDIDHAVESDDSELGVARLRGGVLQHVDEIDGR